MVKAYFTACEQAFPAQRAQLRRLSLALRRSGVERMEQLCALQRAGPETLLKIRRSAPGMKQTEHHRKGVPPCGGQISVRRRNALLPKQKEEPYEKTNT